MVKLHSKNLNRTAVMIDLDKNRQNNKLNFTNKLFGILLPSLFIVTSIFLFGPFAIYQGNIDEFVGLFTPNLKFYISPALIMLSVISIIGLLLTKKIYKRYISLLFILGVLIWLQGNFFVWKYELSGGIDWTKGAWRGWIDGSIWIVLLVTTCLLYRHVYRIAALASIVMLSLQLMYLCFISMQNPEIWKKGQKLPSIFPPQEIFEFSSKQNVIHIILDEFQSTIFQEIIDEDIDYYYNIFDGFTFFKETAGAFPTTIMSIPAILSGKVYKNNVPINVFIEKVFKGRTITNALYDSDYDVDFAVPIHCYCKGQYSNCYEIPVPYGLTKHQYEKKESTFILNLVLFRYVPHFIKKMIYDGNLMLPFLNDRKQYEAARHFAHRAFLQDLIDNASVNRSRRVYKLIHLTTTHWPTVLDVDCKYAGEIMPFTWEEIKVQTKCSLDHLVKFIDKLKLLGIYKSSLLILQADHGYWKVPDSANQVSISSFDKHLVENNITTKEQFAKIVCSALPLMAIKPPYSKGPLKISNVQAALTDIPATINKILNLNYEFGGKSIFDIDSSEMRKRDFHYYERLNRKEDEYFDQMDEYIIKGSLLNSNSWHYVSTILPKLSYKKQKIDIGNYNDSRFLHSGWSFNEGGAEEGLTYKWALGNSASIYISLPKSEAMLLTANMKTLRFRNAQIVTIKVDGCEIGNWVLSPSFEWEKHSIVIKPDKDRPDVSIVEFMFSQYKEGDKKDKRPLAVLFESITLTELNHNKFGLIVQFGESGNSRSFETKGWSSPENNFTWTDGPSASLSMPITMHKSASINLRATLWPFIVPGKVDKQTVEILINGEKAGEWKIVQPGLQKQIFNIPKHYITGEKILEITFNLPNAISPAQLGYNSDKRALGIAVRTLELTE